MACNKMQQNATTCNRLATKCNKMQQNATKFFGFVSRETFYFQLVILKCNKMQQKNQFGKFFPSSRFFRRFPPPLPKNVLLLRFRLLMTAQKKDASSVKNLRLFVSDRFLYLCIAVIQSLSR